MNSKLIFDTFTDFNGNEFVYTGQPNWNIISHYSNVDLIHTSDHLNLVESFPEIVYATYGTWFYLNEYPFSSSYLSWRVDFQSFVLKSKWKPLLHSINDLQCSIAMKGLILGHSLLTSGGIPLHIREAFVTDCTTTIHITKADKYLFFSLFYPKLFSFYLKLRSFDLLSLFSKSTKSAFESCDNLFSSHLLNSDFLNKEVSVSFLIPTMRRQDFVLQLLNDLSNQSYLPTEVVINDATPAQERITDYSELHLPFSIKIIWQQSKGSCKARNECLQISTGEYIIFGDDDIRIPKDYIENHISFLQSNNIKACTGLDITAKHYTYGLEDLAEMRTKYLNLYPKLASHFSNANACIHRSCLELVPGNDVNFDGGYGEDSDFGLSLIKAGIIVMYNPYAFTLHLKPPSGGYRWWGNSSSLVGKKRKKQPWELDNPVGWVKPVPSPTVMYFVYKHFLPHQIREYKIKYILNFLISGGKLKILLRFLNLPYRLYQMHLSSGYAKRLVEKGVRYE